MTRQQVRFIMKQGTIDTITLWRVKKQVAETAPDWATFVDTEKESDAQIVLAIGAREAETNIDSDIPTVLLQLCYKTAHGGSESFWTDIWEKCVLVGSYYDLPAGDNYIRFPMGYNPSVFYRSDSERKREAIVFGSVDGPEEIMAAIDTFSTVAHVSTSDFGYHDVGYTNFVNVTDDRLRRIYQGSRYCVGLRRVEGFEMPIIEGAACGCIPIAFDLECYRHWFDGMAIFIDPNKDVRESLANIKDNRIGEVPDMSLVSRFEQGSAWKPFWDKLGKSL